MLALSLGIAAAFAWAAHDLLVRKLSQGAVLLPMMLAVLAAGGVALLLPALLLAEWSAVGVAGLGGLASLGRSTATVPRLSRHPAGFDL